MEKSPIKFIVQQDLLSHLGNGSTIINHDGTSYITVSDGVVREGDDRVDVLCIDHTQWFRAINVNFEQGVKYLQDFPKTGLLGGATGEVYYLENGKVEPAMYLDDLKKQFLMLPENLNAQT